MEYVVVLHHDLPKTYQLTRLVVLLVNCLQRPVDPARGLTLSRVPVGNQYVQSLLDESSYLVITLTQALEPSDKGKVEP